MRACGLRSLAGVLWLALAGALPSASPAATADGDGRLGSQHSETRERCADYDVNRRPFFGDLHVHTRYSLDAATQDTRTTPADAYRFARGQAIQIQPFDEDGRGLREIQLDRPLDFAGVTDHSELFGELEICRDPRRAGHDSLVCRIFRGMPRFAYFLMNSRSSMGLRYRYCGEDGEICRAAARTPWGVMQEAAAAAYDSAPSCEFTSFMAYEWTGSTGTDAGNLHRNVIFRSAEVPDVPVSFVDARTPEALWAGLDEGCADRGPGCEYVVIPHNSNLSAAKMFPTTNPDGSPFSAEQARRRASEEPLVEIMQHKGESECRIGAGTEDELCGFEKLPYDTMRGVLRESDRHIPTAMNFVRPVLGEGLVQQARIGANPFELGIIGSTDTHLGAAGYVSEKEHPGHGGASPPVVEVPQGLTDLVEFNPGGLAVLWAEENSRDALFAALKRREVYATSGPRMVVRLFAGWEYDESLCGSEHFAAEGYAGGTPMGGHLAAPPADDDSPAPALAVWALKDAGPEWAPGTDLQRVQIIKLWVEDGEARERVFDVAGDPDNGASVDLDTCEPQGSGFESLCRVWRDPEFDVSSPALYYARVLENPSCRWHTYICNANAVDCSDPASLRADLAGCCDPSIPPTQQERSWTSPIWYVP